MRLRNLSRGPVSVYLLCDDAMLEGPFVLPAISQRDVFGVVIGIDQEMSAWVPEHCIEEFIRDFVIEWKESDATPEQRQEKAKDIRQAAQCLPDFKRVVRRIVVGTMN